MILTTSCWKSHTISPAIVYSLEVNHHIQPTLKERGIKLHIWKGEISNNFWTYFKIMTFCSPFQLFWRNSRQHISSSLILQKKKKKASTHCHSHSQKIKKMIKYPVFKFCWLFSWFVFYSWFGLFASESKHGPPLAFSIFSGGDKSSCIIQFEIYRQPHKNVRWGSLQVVIQMICIHCFVSTFLIFLFIRSTQEVRKQIFLGYLWTWN